MREASAGCAIAIAPPVVEAGSGGGLVSEDREG